ncbi:nucleoside diphosphate kinase family protein, partial [Opisthorchis viverrini]
MEEDPNFPHIPIERTLAIIKPEAIRFSDEIEEKILQNQFFIIQKRRVHLTPEQASELYAEHYGKMFFPSLVSYMSSGPISVLVLAKDNAVMSWQKLIGPANSVKARSLVPTSLRALYGTDDQQNALHGSDSIASAEKEIRFFFQDSSLTNAAGSDAKLLHMRNEGIGSGRPVREVSLWLALLSIAALWSTQRNEYHRWKGKRGQII